MGVYIDIDKPKECEECLFYEYDSIFEDERWSSAPKCLLDGDSADCPLIEIDEPKVGKWETKVASNGWNDWYVFECPLCGARIEDKDYHEWDYNYCPNCGAKMERRTDEFHSKGH